MENYIEQLKPLFSQVTEKIGQGVELGWDVILKQQIAFGWTALFMSILGLIGMFVVYKLLTHKDNDGDGVDWDDMWPSLVLIFLGGGSLLAFIKGGIVAILRLTNPEYYTLEFFINLVK